MNTQIAALVVAIALSGLTLPCLAQDAGSGTVGNGGGGGSWQAVAGPQQTENVASGAQQQRARNRFAAWRNNAAQEARQQAGTESRQKDGQPQDQIRQGINPGLINQMRASMRQAGGIGSYQQAWQMAPVTGNPDNMDAAYGRPRMFAELMHQHAVQTQPYRIGGN
ncbi:MAG TPA: hypothetical protein V6C69_03635 [Trichormus sp.]|jgi:hypothetical protein